MTNSEQQVRFAKEHEAMLDHYSSEYDLNGLWVVGFLFATAVKISFHLIKAPPPSQPPEPPWKPPSLPGP